MNERASAFVSVIIPVYNDTLRLRSCLQALERQTYPRVLYEVIVVDNGLEESLEPVLPIFPQAAVVHEARPGAYAARNAGLTAARGDILAFTDSDCIPALDWIEKGVAHLQQWPACGLLGGQIELFFRDPAHPTAVEWYDKIMSFNQKRYIEQANYSATANLFTYRHVIARVGNFDASLKSGGDKEWGRRVASCGYRLRYAADVRVAHPARVSVAQMQAKTRRLAGGFVDSSWKRPLPSLPFIGKMFKERLWLYVPPVLTTCRLKHVTWGMKCQILGIWFLMRYIRAKESWRLRLWGTPPAR